MTVQYFANLTMVTAVVLYLLALIMHCVEWAAMRQNKADVRDAAAEKDLAVASSEVAAPVLATAAVGASAGTATLERTAVAVGGSSDSGSGVATKTGRGDRSPLTSPQRSELFGRLGVVLTVFGLACAIAGVIARGIDAHRLPLANMYEFTTMAMVIIVAAYLVLVKMGMRWLGLPVTLLATIGNGLAVTVFYVAVAPLVPALHSIWFDIHITAASISGSAFNIGGVISIIYLIKARAEKKGTVKGYLAKLPTARRLDILAYRVLAFAFPLWTLTVTAGAIWAEYAWGSYWSWDPKEVWALVTWVIYACYLHARSTAGWKGNRATVIAIIGLASFWFNFIGVNLLFAGLHSYAGV